jgi:hypothetical protein
VAASGHFTSTGRLHFGCPDLFASEYLSRDPTPIERETSLINPPEPGNAIVVDLLFARLAGQLLFMPHQRKLMPHQRKLGCCALSTAMIKNCSPLRPIAV